MIKIGLTGGIGVGKTYVAKIFQKLGIPVFNSDKHAKLCLMNDLNLKKNIENQFGKDIYFNGVLQRKRLAEIVFNDTDALTKLNILVHPVVKKSFRLWCQKQKTNLIIKEAAILFESNSEKDLDFVICVSAPYDERIRRLKERDRCSENDIKQRMSQQMDEDEKQKLSNFIITNDSKQLVLPQIINIIKEIE